MEPSQLKSAVLHSLKWVAAGKIVTQIIRWVITFWVIRLLTPEDYGLVAMADVLFSLLLLIIGTLFSPGIIQAKEIDKLTISRLFGGVLLVHATIFIVQYLSAGAVARYYEAQAVETILKVNAWCFIILAFNVIPQAMLAREMQFKRISIISAIANICAALTTLGMAMLDYGYWSLVIGEVVMLSIKTVLMLFNSRVLVWPRFDLSAVANYIKFGGMLTVHVILFYVFIHMDVFIAGRFLSAAEVGLFALGLQFALMPQKKLLPLLRQVAFPAFSKIQENTAKVKWYVLKAQRLSLMMTIPVFWGLASVVDLVIPVVLGEKWVDAIYPCMIILFVMPLRFSDELFFPALKSQRKVKHMIINTLISTAALLIGLLSFIEYQAVGIALAWLVSFPLIYSVVLYRNCRELKISYAHMLGVIARSMLPGAVMVGGVFLVKQSLPEITVVNMILQVVTGGVIYLCAAFVLNKASVKEMFQLVRKRGSA